MTPQRSLQRSILLRITLTISLLASYAADAQSLVREYFIAAEAVVWDYAPSNQNLVHCDPASAPCPIPEPWTNSHVFDKIRYIQYRDASFSDPVEQPAWLGVLGPVIRAEVGDTVAVHFCNHSHNGPLGMHPHGLRYSKDDEGARYTGVNQGTPPGLGAAVPPGGCFDYTWIADRESGPGLGELSSKVWWYHSHIDEPAETNAGLLGPIIVTRKGMARADGSPRDVDREFVTAFFIFDELDEEEPGLMHSINGFIFGNLRGLQAQRGEKVRWHVLGMGNEVDLHTPHWHGETVQVGATHVARHTDVLELLPATMVTADMDALNVGEWLYHCHVADHIEAGMSTTYSIAP
ncbi:MAG: multicopper oxidase domain-containing protein [Gammaproteobacteria bacterium]